jgi:hypothetical protein
MTFYNSQLDAGNRLDLDEGILRLKELKKRLGINDIIQPSTESVDVIIEILELIEKLDIPIRMTGEGSA